LKQYPHAAVKNFGSNISLWADSKFSGNLSLGQLLSTKSEYFFLLFFKAASAFLGSLQHIFLWKAVSVGWLHIKILSSMSLCESACHYLIDQDLDP